MILADTLEIQVYRGAFGSHQRSALRFQQTLSKLCVIHSLGYALVQVTVSVLQFFPPVFFVVVYAITRGTANAYQNPQGKQSLSDHAGNLSVSRIPPSENIGAVNPLNLVGDGKELKTSSASPLLCATRKTLLPHQYDWIRGVHPSKHVPFHKGTNTSVSFLSISSCFCVEPISNAVLASTS